jgi:hypothetical protein
LWSSSSFAHGLAQERRVVAGERRDDEHGRLRLDLLQRRQVVGEALEASSRQKGFSTATCSCTATSLPSIRTERMSNSGFS